MDNWLPRTSDIVLRGGSSNWVTGITGNVESLMEYGGLTGKKLFAAANNAIYNVTASGAVGAADLSSLTNNRWQHAMMATSGGNFLIIANGADSVRSYDGTNWATPSITGATSSTFIHVNSHKARLWFVRTATLKAYYLPINSIAGAASEFDLGPLAKMGGTLMAMATWTMDGGSGPDDLAVFITSEGEVIVYHGTDPSSAFNWALVGVFRVGRPIGRRCFFKVGSDLVIITEQGFFPLSKALIAGQTSQNIAISDKISGAVATATKSYGGNYGWQALLYPKGTMGIFNIPTVDGSQSHQYVINTITGSWCRFTGMNAVCWSLFNNDLYFGTATKVCKADTGTSDLGSNIVGDVKPAFNYFGRRGKLKRFTMVRPIFTAGATVMPSVGMNIDFEDKQVTAAAGSNSSSGSPWDTSPWDTTDWGTDGLIRKDWQSVTGIGYCGTARIQVASNAQTIALQSIDYMFEEGGYL